MPRAALDGIEINYLRRGTGPEVVLVHGLGADLSFWFLAGLPALAREHRVTAWDLRGHGRSGMPASGYTTGHMVEDLRGLLEHLEVERADIVGHSFGGAVALHLALRYPHFVGSLVLADAVVPALQEQHLLQDWREWPAYRAELQRIGISPIADDRPIGAGLLEDFARGGLREAPDDRSENVFVPFRRRGRRSSGERWLRLIAETSALEDLNAQDGMTRDAIRQVLAPTLALYGEHSPFLHTIHQLRRSLRNCRHLVLPGVGHFHPIRCPAAFTDHSLRFVTEHRDDARAMAHR